MELETWKKDLFLGHLQPPIDENSKHIAILNIAMCHNLDHAEYVIYSKCFYFN